MKYYDQRSGRLIYVGHRAIADYWDGVWGNVGIDRRSILERRGGYVSAITQRYVSPDAGRILEGGCGVGGEVAALKNAGYQVIGIDYAAKTVKALNEHVPELDIRLGDVRELDFEDGYFAGYWSLGVIEHFWEGYDSIAAEMWRVLRKGGYLFVSFPYMNFVRALKARLGVYPKWKGQELEGFNQFALRPKEVRKHFERLGFEFVDARRLLARQGMQDEMPRLTSFMNKLYAYRGRSFALRAFRRLAHEAVSILQLFCSMSLLLVLKKPDG